MGFIEQLRKKKFYFIFTKFHKQHPIKEPISHNIQCPHCNTQILALTEKGFHSSLNICPQCGKEFFYEYKELSNSCGLNFSNIRSNEELEG